MTKLPMVQLRTLAPIVDRLQSEGFDPLKVLEQFKITPKGFTDGGTFLTAPTMYKLAEQLCELSSDPYFAVNVGASLATSGKRLHPSSTSSTHTLQEALFFFSRRSSEAASSTEYSTLIRPDRTTFRAKRTSNYGTIPRHNDAFGAGYLLTMINAIVGNSWDGTHVVVSLSDPGLLPKDYLGCRLAHADPLGVTIEFPSEWLILTTSSSNGKIQQTAETTKIRYTSNPLLTLDAFRKVLEPHLSDGDLNLKKVAGMFDVSESTLKRRLHDQGTTLHKEISKLREKRAKSMLLNSSMPMDTIARELGYSGSPIVTRAFQKWIENRVRKTKERAMILESKESPIYAKYVEPITQSIQ